MNKKSTQNLTLAIKNRKKVDLTATRIIDLAKVRLRALQSLFRGSSESLKKLRDALGKKNMESAGKWARTPILFATDRTSDLQRLLT